MPKNRLEITPCSKVERSMTKMSEEIQKCQKMSDVIYERPLNECLFIFQSN